MRQSGHQSEILSRPPRDSGEESAAVSLAFDILRHDDTGISASRMIWIAIADLSPVFTDRAKRCNLIGSSVYWQANAYATNDTNRCALYERRSRVARSWRIAEGPV